MLVMLLLSFDKGSKSAEGGPNPLADMDRGGPNPNPLGHRLHAGLFFVVGCLLAERDRLTYCTLVCVSSLRTTVRFCLSAHASCFRESDIRFN